MTEIPPQNSPSLSNLSPGGESAGGLTGVFPPAGRAGASAVGAPSARPIPLVVGQCHGILTGDSSPSWPEFGSAYFAARHPHVSTVNTDYFELPLPRVAALRNPSRSRNLVRRMKTSALYQVELREEPAELAFVSHSNGAVLALQACRELIREGIAVRSLVLLAPAIRTKDASREIGGWLASGMLGHALLVRPLRDGVIGWTARNWRTRIAVWPWGSLGHDGWAVDEISVFSFQFSAQAETVDLPDMGHSDPVAPLNRRWLYEAIVAPALGLAPWGGLQPREEGAA